MSKTLVTIVLVLMMGFATLNRASVRPLSLLVLVLLALCLVLLCAWRRSSPGLSPIAWTMIAAIIVLPLLQLLPVPAVWWAGLPGREPYAEALRALDLDRDIWLNLSLRPASTALFVLTWMPPLAVLVATRTLPARHLLGLVWLFLAVALCQSLLGVMQTIDGVDSVWRLGMSNDGHGSATGTYVSRTHLAGLLLMALPLALVPALGHGSLLPRRPSRQRRFRFDWRRPLAWLLVSVLILALLLTQSRAGVALGVLGLVLGVMLLGSSTRERFRHHPWQAWLAAGLAGILVLIIAVPVIQRFLGDDIGGRLVILKATWQGVVTFFPFGSGLGTFPEVFHRFHPPEILRFFINRAHNDYLEWIFGGGVMVVMLLLVLGGMYLRQWHAVLTRSDHGWRALQSGAGLGMGLLLLHGLVDFNLHIPANMLYFGFLTAVFSYSPERQTARPTRRRRSSSLAPPQPWLARPELYQQAEAVEPDRRND